METRLSFLFILLLLSCIVQARSFQKGETIPLFYTKIFSHQKQLTFPYSSLPFICPPYTQEKWQERSLERTWLTLDQDISGDRPVKSDYKIIALENSECSTLCTQSWTVADAMKAKELIQNDYQVEWWLDDIPSATASYTNEISTRVYRVGFPLGQIIDGNVYINNHVTFNILYGINKDNNKIDIIGFEVYPESMKADDCQRKTIDHTMQQVTERRSSVTFTYTVKWKQIQSMPQPNPWDMFLIPPDVDTHFIATINMAIMILLLSLVIGVIMMKTLKKEVVSHDEIHDDFEDVVGWRLVHRDVFRRPIYGGLLAPMIGTGLQVFIVISIIIGSIYKGWTYPAKPGSLISLFIQFYIFSSSIAGYWSSRVHKAFRGKSWMFNAILTSLMLPGFIFICLFIESFFAWSAESSLAISFRGWVTLILLWILVVMPLTLIGAYFGEKCDRIEHPVRTSQMPRLIPKKRWYQQYSMSLLLGGVIPFAIVFVDLNELLKSRCNGEFYFAIPHFVLTCMVMSLTTAQVSVILIFFQLCNEDYHWWWMSFMIGGSSSMYMFIYGLIYYMTKTNMNGFYGGMIYLIQLLLGCVLTGLSTGSIGFFSAYWMIRRIYSAVKMD
ncbi:uncharacterized protein BX664DRAFT_330099 [Halteromyces radiatus]|uniref:uncharacterized protein n=1 Tax=Halteromyces radiatus TaxID=101107 RepID=UPI00221F60BF|nr:uncharacterized protein BX664DRAFT_330099 [Halteromyces radiatus]KAI8093607.1 hypothetical protein BX664DRAFT_330099 [Halteromyces radiatus]